MIGLEKGGEFLDIDDNATLSGEIYNPLFNEDTELGFFTYDITVKLSRKNDRMLGYPSYINRVTTTVLPGWKLWVGSRLFRIGNLNLIDATATTARITFVSDAGAMAAAKDDGLRDIALGFDNLTLTVKDTYPLANYALFPVKNAGFYGDKNPAFCLYLNYYFNGFHTNNANNGHSIVPFPYLAHVLHKVFAHYGFHIKGSWISDPETCRIVIDNTYALDLLSAGGINQYQTLIDFRNHVPDMKVSDFLKALRKMLGLAFIYKPNTREVEIIRLKTAVENPAYADLTDIVVPGHNWQPNETDGFILEMKSGGDSLVKESDLKFQTGKGKTTIPTDCSTPGAGILTDHMQVDRHWLVPDMAIEGNSPEYGLGTDNDFPFRLMNYYGLQPDSNGYMYPLGTNGATNMTGLNIGTQALTWSGPRGLYEQAYKSWLNFKGTADPIVVPLNLGFSHFSILNPAEKIMLRTRKGTIKAFWEKIEFQIHNRQGLKASKVTLHKISS